MPKLMVHGGNFAKGDGWFYLGGRFVLRDKNGRPESILLARVEAADHASEVSLTSSEEANHCASTLNAP